MGQQAQTKTASSQSQNNEVVKDTKNSQWEKYNILAVSNLWPRHLFSCKGVMCV